MQVLNNINTRIKTKNENFYDHSYSTMALDTLQTRLNARGGPDQWIRMREDKLRSLKKALLYSYQRAIVQKYDVKKNTQANNIIQLITRLQDQQELNDNEKVFLDKIEQENEITVERGSAEYIQALQSVVDKLVNSSPMFRCLINHDKLKVDYEDKVISIPFEETPVGEDEVKQTDFHNGTVFKWVHGNKQEWTPDTYWIVYMQYSEETAYFRAEIRKADEEIEIITIGEDGAEAAVTYRGWSTGPNETSIVWNTKKGITWNDMNYTKLLYITKDEDTLAFFKRFDRVIINGKPWEVQAYNDNYSTAGTDMGIIRVALKETYTSTDQFIKQSLEAAAQAQEAQIQYDAEHTDARIDGPEVARPFDILTFVAKNFEDQEKKWDLFGTKLARIINTSEDGLTVTIEIVTGKSNKEGFYINYGDSQDTKIHVTIESL